MKDALLSREDLLEEGWVEGEQLAKALAEASRYEEKGNRDRKYVLKKLRRRFPPESDLPTLRKTPAPLEEALEPETAREERLLKAVRQQLAPFLMLPVVKRASLMPDCCPIGDGASVPVGATLETKRALIPSAHGQDICCSMHATFFNADTPAGEMLDELMACTRFGPGGRAPGNRVEHPVLAEPVWENPFLKGLEEHAEMHMADQGNGNHFALIGEMPVTETLREALVAAGYPQAEEALGGAAGWKVLVTHHGSRGLGAQLFNRGLAAAQKQTAKTARGIPPIAAWLDYGTEEGQAYWEALQYTSRWTRANHDCIHRALMERLGTKAAFSFGHGHNFIWKRGDHFLHGKGATPAWTDAGRPELGLVPLNMAAPLLITLGRDNTRFLSFCPHGAGREISRRGLLRDYRKADGAIDEERLEQAISRATRDVDARWWTGRPDLTETPVGYKDPETVKARIARYELAEVVAEIHPLGCIMAGRPLPRDEEELSPKQIRQQEHRATRRKDRMRMRDLESDEW